MIVNKAAFAQQLGVSRAAISNAVKRGKLPTTNEGKIDTEDPRVAAYVEKHDMGADGKARAQKAAHAKRKTGAQSASEGKGPQTVSVGGDPLNHGQVNTEGGGEAGAEAEKLRAEIEWKRTQIKLNIVKIGEAMGRLVDRDVVARKYAALDGELKTRILDLPKRVAPQIVAMVQSGADAQQIQEFLNDELTDGYRAAKEASKRTGPESI